MKIGSGFEYPYRVRQKRLTRAQRKKEREQAPIDHKLRRIGIAPFKTSSVHKYMSDRVASLRNPPVLWMDEYTPNSTLICLGLLFGVLAGVMGIVTTIPIALAFAAGGILCWVFGWRGNRRMVDCTPRSRPTAEWRKMPFDSYVAAYGSTIPPKIMKTAGQIKREIPHTSLNVHYLYEDPFLEVLYYPPHGQSASRFVEFWNEDGFVHD